MDAVQSLQSLQSTAGFGELLRIRRERVGLTQQVLADHATLSVRAIRDMESGRVQRPRQETVRLLADALRLEGPNRSNFEAACAPAGARRGAARRADRAAGRPGRDRRPGPGGRGADRRARRARRPAGHGGRPGRGRQDPAGPGGRATSVPRVPVVGALD
ncbi:helix-turn-helix transcriptional regulator [Streptomyces sp. MS1.HAVA.3]|uniref:Helix-turn-helix transcriptional regulator n=1 Tax=Streptomyces caledonius TaxID=3134107 RepID=A0ABU8U0Q2_9ACTN